VSARKPDEEVSFQPGPDDWEVTCRGRYSGRRLLVALADALPPGLTLYVEGTSIAPIVATYFEDRPAQQPLRLRRGIIWPRPKAYHMPMTPENVAGLAGLMENLAEPQVCDHLHAYMRMKAYLIWYDAWFDSPLYLRKDVPEEAVRRLCEYVGCEYTSGPA
jgi:hypothetical protein